MNGERCRDANLPFEPSMRRADGALAIAIIECATADCFLIYFWQNEAKMVNTFKGDRLNAALTAAVRPFGTLQSHGPRVGLSKRVANVLRLWWRTWTGRILTAVRRFGRPLILTPAQRVSSHMSWTGCFRQTDASVIITRFSS